MAERSETSPLLTVENNHTDASSSSNDITSFPEVESYTTARDFFPQIIKILTTSILVTSAISFIILFTTGILITKGTFVSYYWNTIDCLEAVGAFVFIAFVAAVINLRVKFPIFFNFLIDIFLVWNFLIWSTLEQSTSYRFYTGATYPFSNSADSAFLSVPELLFSWGFPKKDWCEYDKYDPTKGIKPGCLPWMLAAKILMGVGGGLAALVGVAHLVLLFLRCVASWRSKFWRRPSSLTIPTGELTFQFTIKHLRQERTPLAPVAPTNGIAAAST